MPKRFHIDSLRGGRTQFYLKKGDIVIQALAKNVKTDNFENENGEISWKEIAGDFEYLKLKTPKIDFSAGETSIVHDATSVSKNVRFQMETRKATIKGTVPELKFQDEINGKKKKNIILKSLEMSDPKIEMQLNNLVKNSGSNEKSYFRCWYCKSPRNLNKGRLLRL